MEWGRVKTVGVAATLLSAVVFAEAQATEGGASLYVAGTKGIGAGILPPEGFYSSNPLYFYGGSTSREITEGGIIVNGGLDVDAFAYFPTALWVTPIDVFGGDLAIGVTAVLGVVDATASGTISSAPNINLSPSRNDSFGGWGDPVLTAALGWHEGTSYWNVTTMVNVPIGQYDVGELANLSFHRWAVDITGAYTWFDPAVGIDITAAAGFTFNGTNTATDYTSGHEFHFELIAAKYLTETVALGVNFFHGQQITGDSGSGAVLGDFKGQVTAIGPELNAMIPIAGVPVFANFKYIEELAVENRVRGRAGWITLTVPMGAGSK